MRYIHKDMTSDLVMEAQSLLDISEHYNEYDRLRDIVRILYSGCCAFCESTMEEASFFQIEHFYPQGDGRFADYVKRIENLHYCCQRCNMLKGRRLHTKIFSPNLYLDGGLVWKQGNTRKIESEMYYVGHLLFSRNLTDESVNRGQETIRLFNLNNANTSGRNNRNYLVETRIRLNHIMYNLLQAVFQLLVNYQPVLNRAIEVLLFTAVQHMNGDRSYSTMVVHNFGDDLLKLLTIYKRIRVTV